MIRKVVIGSVSVLLLLPSGGLAETRYVSDQLVITLREAARDSAPMIKTLRTDTAVEILGEQGAFFRVREPGGKEGYVLKQYISPQLPKPRQIDHLKKENASLDGMLKKCREELSGLRDTSKDVRAQDRERIAELEALIADLEQEKQTRMENYDAIREKYEKLKAQSENVVQLAEENKQLHTDQSRLSEENVRLAEQNQKLMMKGIIQWFLAGGGVFFIGWLSGKFSRRKKSSFMG
jgi:SH3 domain protein